MSTDAQTRQQNNFFDICKSCQESCCRGPKPPITKFRRQQIESYLAQRALRIAEPFIEEDYVFPREAASSFCIFHDERSNKCIVHPVKPETCVAGPITFDLNKITGNIEYYLKMESICSLAGIISKNQGLLEKHLEVAKHELSRLVCDLDSKALQAILKKDEPYTTKICTEHIREV